MTKRVAVLILSVLPVLSGQDPVTEKTAADAALYQRGLRLIEEGHYETARLALQTLLNSYPDSAFRHQSRNAIRDSWSRQGIPDVDAFLLYLEGTSRLSQGKHQAARLAFQTLINQYPNSAYVAKARDRIRESQKAEPSR